MTVATDPAIFKMGNFNVELDKLRDWNKAGKLFPKVSDSAYHFLYHVPASYTG